MNEYLTDVKTQQPTDRPTQQRDSSYRHPKVTSVEIARQKVKR
jgi:hypothetical protein